MRRYIGCKVGCRKEWGPPMDDSSERRGTRGARAAGVVMGLTVGGGLQSNGAVVHERGLDLNGYLSWAPLPSVSILIVFGCVYTQIATFCSRFEI